MKSPSVEVGEDHLFTFFILDEYSHGAFNDVVQRFCFFTLGWISVLFDGYL